MIQNITLIENTTFDLEFRAVLDAKPSKHLLVVLPTIMQTFVPSTPSAQNFDQTGQILARMLV